VQSGEAARVRIELCLDSIYRNSLLSLQAFGTKGFSLRCLTGPWNSERTVPALAAYVEKGSVEGDALVGQADARRADVVATMAAGFYEKLVAAGPDETPSSEGEPGDERVPPPIRPVVRMRRSQRAAEQYGMRFYPFVSSTLEVTFDTPDARIDALTVRLSQDVRPVEYAALLIGNETVAPVDTTSGDEVILIYDLPEGARKVDLALPLRIGGPRLAHAYNYPLVYWGLGLAGVALTARIKPDFTLAAVVALAVFLVQQWRHHERPQRLSLLHGFYVLGGALTAGWGYIWANASTALHVIATVVVLALWVSGIHLILRFERSGDLPLPVAWTWSWAARLLERRA
jgi:hypothetical protein